VSLLPADEITYVDYVAEYFLAQKGAALTLSPPDVDLVRGYEGEGIPFEVLCRGIERAFEVRRRHGRERTPHLSLRSCKRSIDAEVRRHRKGALRGAGPVADPARIDRLLGLLRTATQAPAQAAYRAAYRAACAGDAVEPAAAFAYLATLPRPEQRTLCRATLSVLPRTPGTPSWERRAAVRAALTTAALEHGKLALS
jgi:hypothetical protein